MKSGDAKKPKFDAAWWKKNKSKKADTKDALAKTLTAYANAKKSFTGGISEMTGILDSVKKAAESEAKSKELGTFQKETKEALLSYAKIAEKAKKDLAQITKAPIMHMTVDSLIKNAPQFKAHCKKEYQMDSFNFLSLMYKNPVRERKWYDAFIAADSSFPINIKGRTKKTFDEVAKQIDNGEIEDTPAAWKDCAWDQAVKEIESLLRMDVVPRFTKNMCTQLGLKVLP